MLKSVKGAKHSVIHAQHTDPLFLESLADCYLYCDGKVPLLFTENETNTQRIFGAPNQSPYVKDSIHNYIVHGQKDAVNPGGVGTKASPHYQLTVGPGASAGRPAPSDGDGTGRTPRSVRESSMR